MRTAAEEAFIDQMTRSLLVKWADHSVRRGGEIEALGIEGIFQDCSVYVAHALSRGFITKKQPHQLTAKGWGTAASFLKR